MGVLERLFNSSKETKVKTSVFNNTFTEFNKHMDYHRMWINYLHENIKQLHHSSNSLNQTHFHHREELKTTLKSMSEWVNYLYKSQKQLEKDVKSLESNLKTDLRTSMKEEMKKYHNDLLLHISGIIESQAKYGKIKEEVLFEVENKIRSIEKSQKLPAEPIKAEDNELTFPEKELLNFLFNQSTPLTYTEIARRTKKSVNSIRVYMNNLKVKKDLIEEFRQPNGIKIFAVKNKEKIKTLYNLA
ncbi:MAG: hypothetical protein V1859_07520 [archaeon]